MKCPVCNTNRVDGFSSSTGTFYKCKSYRCKATWRRGRKEEAKVTSKLTMDRQVWQSSEGEHID